MDLQALVDGTESLGEKKNEGEKEKKEKVSDARENVSCTSLLQLEKKSWSSRETNSMRCTM